MIYFFHFQECDFYSIKHRVESWPRRKPLPSLIGLIHGPFGIQLSVRFLYHFGIRCCCMILRNRCNGVLTKSYHRFHQERSTTFACFREQGTSCISWCDLPRFLDEDIAFIHSQAHMLDGETGDFLSMQECILYRRWSPIFWQDRRMYIQESHRRDVQELLRQDFPVRDDETDIRIEFFHLCEKFLILPDFLRLEKLNAMFTSELCNRRCHELMATTTYSIWICHNSDDFEVFCLCHEILEYCRREARSSEKEGTYFLHRRLTKKKEV